MTDPQGPHSREQWLVPSGLLLGCALSFVACCALGRLVSRQSPYKGFVRFHPLINHLSLYYPTASQTRALGRALAAPDQVLVIVGGNSIMHGSGQGADQVWTKQLQARLGPRYRVLNFALHGSGPAEFGATAAEVLERDGRKVLFITNQWMGTANYAGEVDGFLQRYFFWDAYYKGLFAPGPEREARLAQLAAEKKDDEPYAELRRRARLDGWLYCQDLWTTFSYRCASTVWCPLVAESFTRPRRRYPDPDGGIPLALRYGAMEGPEVMPRLANWLPYCHTAGVPASGPDPDYGGTILVRSYKLCFPEPARGRTLVLFNRLSPYYVKRLPADIQARHAADFVESVRALEQAGFAALELGRGYTDLDYNDHCHFSREGAAKIAADVAPKVRQMARDLGYTE
jgi:hypothetical protein